MIHIAFAAVNGVRDHGGHFVLTPDRREPQVAADATDFLTADGTDGHGWEIADFSIRAIGVIPQLIPVARWRGAFAHTGAPVNATLWAAEPTRRAGAGHCARRESATHRLVTLLPGTRWLPCDRQRAEYRSL